MEILHMLTIHVWPKRLKEFLLTHSLYKSPVGILGKFCEIEEKWHR